MQQREIRNSRNISQQDLYKTIHTSSHRIVTIHAHALLQTTQAAIISQTSMLTSPDTMYPHNGSSTAATSCWYSVISFLVLL